MRPYQFRLLITRRKRRLTQAARQADLRLHRLPLLVLPAAILLFTVVAIGGAWALEKLRTGFPTPAQLESALDFCPVHSPTRLVDRSGQIPLAVVAEPALGAGCLSLTGSGAFSPALPQVTIARLQPGFHKEPALDFTHLNDPAPHTIAERAALDWYLASEPPTLTRALRMRLLAAELQQRAGRDRLLTAWLNQAWFGRLAYGADAAARLYLGVSATELSPSQAAWLVERSLAPETDLAADPDEFARLWQLGNAALLRAGLPVSDPAPPQLALPPPLPQPAFTRLVLDQAGQLLGQRRIERGGLVIRTTLDAGLQGQMTCLLPAQLRRISQGGTHQPADSAACPAARLLPILASQPLTGLQASAAVLDPLSGEVLALSGSLDAEGLEMDLPSPPAAPLFSPFPAAAAFTRGYAPATLVWDLPSGAEETAEGPLRLRRALLADRYRPLDEMITALNPRFLRTVIARMGLPRVEGQDLFLAPGGPQLSVLDLAHAWSTFANLGTQFGLEDARTGELQPRLILEITAAEGALFQAPPPATRNLLDPAAAWLVHDVLADPALRWELLGQGNPLEFAQPAAAKLGRTASGENTWAAGYTRERVAVVWLGPGTPDPAQDPIDPRYAAGIWHALMQLSTQDQAGRAWEAPPGVTRVRVCDPSGLLPTPDCPLVVEEAFLLGSEPRQADTLFQNTEIDRETGLLATALTAPDLRVRELLLRLPPAARAWGEISGRNILPAAHDVLLRQPPSPVHILSPQPLEIVSGQVTLRLSAGPEGLLSLNLQAGAGANPRVWYKLGQTDATADWTVVWDTTPFAGLVTLRLEGLYAEERLETAFIMLSVDNRPPHVWLDSPAPEDSQSLASGVLLLEAGVQEDLGLASLEWLIDDAVVGVNHAPPWEWAWTAPAGPHTVQLRARDLAGHETLSPVVELTIHK